MVGRIDDRLRETIEEMLLAVISQDAAAVLTSLIKRVSNIPAYDSALAIDEGSGGYLRPSH